MRTKNSRPLGPYEFAYLADVKSVPCVFCNAAAPTEAHHPKGCQGLHWNAISACTGCHNAHVWNFGAMNELEAMNETKRRVDEFRAPGSVTIEAHHSLQHGARAPRIRNGGTALSSSKTVKNRFATARREA
jgi:hypothetical protein